MSLSLKKWANGSTHPLRLTTKGYLLDLIQGANHIDKDWAFSLFGPGTQVVRGTKWDVYNCTGTCFGLAELAHRSS